VDRDGDTVFARLAGELDLAAEEPLDTLFGQLAGEAATRNLIVDLRGISFMDSTGLRILLKQEMGSRRDGFDFALIPPRGPAMKVLRLSGVDRLIELRTDSGEKLSDGAKAGDRASAGLGTTDDDPADWLSQPVPPSEDNGPMEIF
jgi:anti-anti-sigma factor